MACVIRLVGEVTQAQADVSRISTWQPVTIGMCFEQLLAATQRVVKTMTLLIAVCSWLLVSGICTAAS